MLPEMAHLRHDETVPKVGHKRLWVSGMRGCWRVVAVGLVLLGWVGAQGQRTGGSRTRELVDRGWKFALADVAGASAAGFEDAGWQDVNLPHSFSEPYFRSADFYTGYGWYRKHLRLAAARAGERTSLEFEGVFQDAEVWVNGVRVGEHLGGYTGFTLDCTKAVKAGDNVVAVRVNNLWNGQLNPRAGEHVFSGGIYRNVYVVRTAAEHVTWYGTWVTTPKVSEQAATVEVKTEVENDSAAGEAVELTTRVLGPDGREVARYRSVSRVEAGAVATVEQRGEVRGPKLWSPETPALYTAVSEVRAGGRLKDTVRTRFGVRWFTWTAEDGLTLNGRHRYFHGADVHQDHAGWGDAVTDAGARRDVEMVKEAGFDFIRGSHYPHSPAFVDACDELGVLFWSENTFWGMGGDKDDEFWDASAYPVREEDQAPFEAHVKESLKEMIRIHRNHPAVIVWSMSNEPFFTAPAVMGKMRELLAALVAESHALDPTRPAAIGGAQRGKIDLIGDVAGYNGDGARLFLHPKVANAVTEYGSAREVRPGTYDPHLGDLAGQPEFAWRGGQAIWCMFDHGSIAGLEGTMGIVDYFRLPKRGWYWYRNALRGVAPPEWPVEGQPAGLRLTASREAIEHADGSEDAQVIVTVVDAAGKALSNSPEVTLEVVDGPGGFPTGRKIVFKAGTDIPILDGQAAIEFRPYFAGKTVLRATSPGLKEARLEIVARGAPKYAAGRTPEFLPGPYVRFVGRPGAVGGAYGTIGNIALDRPTHASSEATGHSARLASDGDAGTYWSAAYAGSGAWWDCDLEGVYEVTGVTLRFAGRGRYGFAVQTSDDRIGWKTVTRDSGDGTATVELPAGTRTSGLRVVLEEVPAGSVAGLAEVQVRGSRSR